MTDIHLSPQQKGVLEKRHRTERRAPYKSGSFKGQKLDHLDSIAQALRVHVDTIRAHLVDYSEENKLKPENGGSKSHLNEEQTTILIQHLEEKTYVKVSDICAYVLETFKVTYSVAGMTKWLHANNFSYKKPAGIPSKADPKQQEAFIKFYKNLLEETPSDEPMEFGDGVYPGWQQRLLMDGFELEKTNQFQQQLQEHASMCLVLLI
jgi:transposase